MVIVNTSANYWISQNALSISLNALGEPNRIQCSVASGSAILCYIRGVKPASASTAGEDYSKNGDGLEYDFGHNYKRWPLVISPTYFNSDTEKFVYVAIPRSASVGTQAVVVFPSQKLDIYGYTIVKKPVLDAEGKMHDANGNETTDGALAVKEDAQGEQIGNDNYFYIWLQGTISEVKTIDGTLAREWSPRIESGTLSTDEAISTPNSDWYHWDELTQTVTFLKEIWMESASHFRNLVARIFILNGHTLTGVAVKGETPSDSDDTIVTPAYLGDMDGKFLRKDQDDRTEYSLGIGENLDVGGDVTVVGTVSANGAEVLGDASVAGKTATGELEVTGDATVGGDVTAENVNASGDGNVNGNLGVGGNASVGGNTIVNANATVQADLTVGGVFDAIKGKIDELRSHNYSGSGVGDSGWLLTSNDGSGASLLEVDKLLVRMKATFMELEVRKETFVGGNQHYSPAGSVIFKVDYLDINGNPLGYKRQRVSWLLKGISFLVGNTAFARTRHIRYADTIDELTEEERNAVATIRCYLISDDGTNATRNWWQVGDQARCQSFNYAASRSDKQSHPYDTDKAGVTDRATPLSSDFYWRLITRCGSALGDDNKMYDWVDFPYEGYEDNGEASTFCAPGSGLPKAGDTIVCMGNRYNASRMNMVSIISVATDDYDAPAVKGYRGIHNFSLDGCLVFNFSPSSVSVRSREFRWITDTGDFLPPTLERGEYVADERYHYYDRVSHNGSIWLCIIGDTRIWIYPDGTPSPTPTDANITEGEGNYEYAAGHFDHYFKSGKVIGRTVYYVRNYTTDEPTDTDSGVWLKEVTKGTEITQVVLSYAASTSGTVIPTTGWKTVDPNGQYKTPGEAIAATGISQGQYLWMQRSTYYSDGRDAVVEYVPARWGVDGDGIEDIDYYFYATKSAETINAQTDHLPYEGDTKERWFHDYNALVNKWGGLGNMQGVFVWTKTIVQYDPHPADDGSERHIADVVSYSCVRMGMDGQIVQYEYYCLKASDKFSEAFGGYTYDKCGIRWLTDGQPDADRGRLSDNNPINTDLWKTTKPDYPGGANMYLWNFEYRVDGQGTAYATKPVCIGNHARGIVGNPIEVYACSVSAVPTTPGRHIPDDIWNANGNSETDISHEDQDNKRTWSDEAYNRAPDDTLPYQWNMAIITYSDGSKQYVYHVSGVKGTKGEDGAGTEYIYKLVENASSYGTHPNDINRGKVGGKGDWIDASQKATTDDWVPEGWTDSPTGITRLLPIELVSQRTKTTGGTWGDFSDPKPLSHWGRNGEDGDGVEYVFLLTKNDVPPLIVYPNVAEDSGRTYLSDEYLPTISNKDDCDAKSTRCTDNPTGTSRQYPYEWVMKRTKGSPDAETGARQWEQYGGDTTEKCKMSKFSTFAENAIRLDTDNDMDMVQTDSTGKITKTRTVSTIVRLYDGANEIDIHDKDIDVTGGLVPTQKAEPNNGLGRLMEFTFTAGQQMNAVYDLVLGYTYHAVNKRYNTEFTIAASMGQPIYQLKGSQSAIIYKRQSNNSLVSANSTLAMSVLKIDGDSTSELTIGQSGMSVYYKFDAMPTWSSKGNQFPPAGLTVGSDKENVYVAMFNANGVLLDRETFPVLKDGENGDNADTPIAAYKWDQSASDAPELPSAGQWDKGWSATAPNRTQGYEGWFLWMTQSTKHTAKNGTVTYDNWSPAVRISGDKGSAGEDAEDVEWIYSLTESTIPTSDGTGMKDKDGVQRDDEYIKTHDDFVPLNWNDNPVGIDPDNPNEWACYRIKERGATEWGKFMGVKAGAAGDTPLLWSHYGERGMDGDGVEYVFARTTLNEAPILSRSQEGYETDEFLPQASVTNQNRIQGNSSSENLTTDTCSDDPKEPDATWRYTWMAMRTKVLNADGKTRTWTPYRGKLVNGEYDYKMMLWSNWSEDGKNAIRLALDNEHEDFLYSDTGLVSPRAGATSPIHLYDGSIDKMADVTELKINDTDNDAETNWKTSVNTNATATVSGATLTVSGLIANSVKIRVRALYKNNYYYTEFTANKTSQDKYDIVTTPNAIAINTSDTWVRKSITLKYNHIDLAGNHQDNLTPATTKAENNVCVYYSFVKEDGTLRTPDLTLVTPLPFVLENKQDAENNIGIYFELRKLTNSSGTTYRMCDNETVEIAKTANGSNGASSPSVVFTPSMLYVDANSDGWSTEGDKSFAVDIGLEVNGTPVPNINNVGTPVVIGEDTSYVSAEYNTVTGKLDVTVDGDSDGLGWDGTFVKLTVGGVLDNITYQATGLLPIVGKKEGADGEDAWSVIATPSPIIVNQNIEDPTDFGFSVNNPLHIAFVARCGDETATVGTVTASNAMGLAIDPENSGNNRLRITAYNKVDGSYVTRGTITCNVPLTCGTRSTNVTIYISVAVNLIGSWNEKIVGDTKTEVAKSLTYGYDPTQQEPIELQNFGQYIKSSEENISTIQSTVNGHTNSISTLQQTDNEIKQSVKAVEAAGNHSLNDASLWVWSNSIDYGGNTYKGIKTKSSTVIPFNDISHLIVSKKCDWVVRMDFYETATSTTAKKTAIIDLGNEQEARYNNYGEDFYRLLPSITTSDKIHYVKLTIFSPNDQELLSNVSGLLNSAQPMIENYNLASEGYVDVKATSVAIGVQTDIEGKLENTGIYIEQGKIEMQADDFTLKNNSGETSLGVDEEGNTMVRGTIYADYLYRGLGIGQTQNIFKYTFDDGSEPTYGTTYHYNRSTNPNVNFENMQVDSDGTNWWTVYGTQLEKQEYIGNKDISVFYLGERTEHGLRVYLPDPTKSEGRDFEIYNADTKHTWKVIALKNVPVDGSVFSTSQYLVKYPFMSASDFSFQYETYVRLHCDGQYWIIIDTRFDQSEGEPTDGVTWSELAAGTSEQINATHLPAIPFSKLPTGTGSDNVAIGNHNHSKDYVSTSSNQGLSYDQKSNARNNIGAGTSSLTLGTGGTNAYYGDKGKIAYDHSQSAHAPSDANKADIAYDTTNKKITKTINGTAADVVTAERIVTDGGGLSSSNAAIIASNDRGVVNNITEYTDLNNIKTPGTYCCQSSNVAQTLTHTPYTGGNFRLWHIQNTGTTGADQQWSAQLLLAPNHGRMFLRGFDSSNFTGWKEFAYVGDFLSSSGGTLTGNLTLKPSDANYGLRLIFGDLNGSTPYAYIGEDDDDMLTVYAASGVELNTGSNSNVTINGSVAATQSWVKSNTVKYLGVYQGAGTCTATGTTRNVTLAGFSFKKWGVIKVTFSRANSANQKINVNGKGDTSIKYKNANISANVISANSTVAFVYDGTDFNLIPSNPTLTVDDVVLLSYSGSEYGIISSHTLSSTYLTVADANSFYLTTSDASNTYATLNAAPLISANGTNGVQSITENTDLNTIKTAGTYYCTSGSVATTLSNTPYKGGNFRLWHIINTINTSNNNQWSAQLLLAPSDGRMFLRGFNSSNFTDWKEFALSGNTTITLGSSSATNPYILFKHSTSADALIQAYQGKLGFGFGSLSKSFTIDTSGNATLPGTLTFPKDNTSGIYFGNSDYGIVYDNHDQYHNEFRFFANSGSSNVGGFTFEGRIFAEGYDEPSDLQMKDVSKENYLPTLEEVAKAPAIQFTWKDRENSRQNVGSTAQYWQEVLPEVVSTKADGVLSMNYGVTALLSAISTAREVVALREEVRLLKQMIQEMKEGTKN